ncbi:TonB-dependent receptor [Marinihelvus fidelis]|uniref:TonB-dependent receptor n=1 Tax=Marinihelvus fidelis TaxID=2613842 RepID=A0A5N0TB57_9GAMM|nr:TonB-dependent receptor [Marinihelvus fidelis]KAA9131046.1 TonB-dependent receptor [Marinihelvus fidelis]
MTPELETRGRSRLTRMISLGLATMIYGASMPALAQQSDTDAEEDVDALLEEVVVTGFRRSLQVALDVKRDSVGAVDAIMAEDIADFPDTNLAESLQRIPGVAINRFEGEGNAITVRGLGGRYTLTRINGMETRAGVATNTGRGFDFNMFASELFNSIVVHKTAAAELQEGSLGAIVDLNTAHAFDYEEGITALVGGQAIYNENRGEFAPRATGLFAYHDPDGVWGFSGSVAYSESKNETLSGNTVRFQKASFNSVLGVDCSANPGDAGCAEVSDGYHARIPRYGGTKIDRERLGITAGLQWAPSDRTEITLDGMYANYDYTRDFRTIEVLFRGNEGGMDVTSYDIQEFPDRYGSGNNTITAMGVDNAWVRSETYYQETESVFEQFTLQVTHDFTDTFSFAGHFGTTESTGESPVTTTLMYDDRDYNGYVYDYHGDGGNPFPTLAFNGGDVTDGSIFTLTELRDQVHKTTTGFDNMDLNLSWQFTDSLELAGGYAYKKFDYKTRQDRRDGTVCGLGLWNCDTDGDGVDDILGPQGTADLSDLYTYGGNVGEGSDSVWAAPSLEGWTSLLDYYNYPLSPDQGRYADVTEETSGAWIQLNGDHIFSNDMRFMYNVGVRYVETDQTSAGFNSGQWVEVERPKYDDTLPSLNAALWLTENVVVRGSWAETLTRPALGNLSPGGSVDSFNYAINFQNPNLDPTRSTNFDASVEWYFADEAVLSFAYFTKDIESFPIRELTTGTFASTGLPLSVISPTSPASQDLEGTCGDPAGCWEISQLVNGPGADLSGFEIAVQTPFSVFLGDDIPVLRNMGVVANYTDVSSDVEYNYSGNIITERILGQSDTSYNFTMYYENGTFDARVAISQRDDYLESGPNRSGNLWQFVDPATFVDLSTRYRFNENFDVTFEILNVTDEPLDNYVDTDARRRLDYSTYGTNYLLGFRYKF